MTENNYPIDAVITWVDGMEPQHIEKILPYLDDKAKINTASYNNRFRQINEIKYTVESILTYATFIRKIYIVTDQQTPAFLKPKDENLRYKKVEIVDHKTIFFGYEKFLPTFNNRSIETCLYRIPQLAEHFIYMNDDIFLINKVVPEDFFRDGKPVLRGIWSQFEEKKFKSKFKKPKIGHKTAQQLAAKLLGFKRYFRFRHTPHPMRKSTFEAYFTQHEEVFIKNIKYKFRSVSQFTPQGLANHLEIKNNTCILKKDLQFLYFRSYKKPLIWYRFKLNIKSRAKLFLGLQSLSESPEEIQDYVLKWLEERVKIN